MTVKDLLLDAYDDARNLARLMDDPFAIVTKPSDSPVSLE
jgi:hypothetical protein